MSLPSRERGLKYEWEENYRNLIVSLPSRERGLKLSAGANHLPNGLSLPSRERGLKLPLPWLLCCIFSVAPFAGAWIEIVFSLYNKFAFRVAPFAGAWIEILHPLPVFPHLLSLPSRERGLKLLR